MTATQAVIMERIDIIARELSELRKIVDRSFSADPSRSLTAELLGLLGSKPVEAYDHYLA